MTRPYGCCDNEKADFRSRHKHDTALLGEACCVNSEIQGTCATIEDPARRAGPRTEAGLSGLSPSQQQPLLPRCWKSESPGTQEVTTAPRLPTGRPFLQLGPGRPS